jgi:hypothetical protein
MKAWKRYRSLRRLVVAFAAVAVAVPVAQAQATQQDPGLTRPATAQTAKRVYGIPAASYRRLPAEDQEALRPPRSVATYSTSSTRGGISTPAVFDSSSTSSWGDASIWGASGLVLISFAALGGALLARRSRVGQPAV